MSFKNLFSFIWQFIRLQPIKFFFIYFLSLTWSIDSTVWPYLLRLIIDTLTSHDGDRASAWGPLKWLLVTGICLWIFVEFCFRSRDFLKSKAFPKFEAAIRMTMFDHIQHHSPKYFNEHFAGSLSNKIGDMTTHITSMLQNLMVFIPAVLFLKMYSNIFIFVSLSD
jgi:ATP-binding cassette, subfamily B, bacterial